MAELAFSDDFKLFDGSCVRFYGYDGKRKVLCGVTAEALKRCDAHLPHTGLIPAEEFLEAFGRLLLQIHNAARIKHAKGKFEQEGDIEVLIKRHDLLNN
jgi:Protein of unknown function (DUF1488)